MASSTRSARARAAKSESSTVSESKTFKLVESELENVRKTRDQIIEEARSKLGSSGSSSRDGSRPEIPSKKTAHQGKEFGGTIGAFFLLFLLPATLYYLTFNCTIITHPAKNKTGSLPPKKEFHCSIFEFPHMPPVSSLFDMRATLIFLGWFAFQAFLACLPLGKVVEGTVLPSGERLKYRCNAFIALLVSLVGFAAAVYLNFPVEKLYDIFPQLLTAAITFSYFLSIFLYIKARAVSKSKKAIGGNTGSIIYDFFIGHELNPRIGSFDLKFFCELRPGLIGWVVLDLSFLLRSYKETGTLHPGLTLVTIFQFFYVADGLFFEEAILTTMDIIHDGFGFMLIFGDLAWVPFAYCLQARFLLMHPTHMPWYFLTGIVVLKAAGFCIFRGANSEKDAFRQNPHQPRFANASLVRTSTGKNLLASGWWGICRKPNYFGDLLMALSWSLPCGFEYIIPYFYPIYFLVLLVHRERRDAHHCEIKYGASWKSYCQKVRSRIFPGIY